MTESNFNIQKKNNNIISINKDDDRISIMQSVDNDIWFSTNKDETTIKLLASSFNYSEWETYSIFEDLIKRIRQELKELEDGNKN